MNLSQIKKKVIPILKSRQIAKAAIFGSYADRSPNKQSDIDILIDFGKNKHKKSLLDLIGLEQELTDATQTKVDLITYGSIYPPLKETIAKQQKTIL